MKTLRVLFVCHGNICRSTMAQFVLQDMVEKKGIAQFFTIDSAATSREEIGNDVHYGTRQILEEQGITCGHHRARQIKSSEVNDWDYFIGMDEMNMRNMRRILGPKADERSFKLLEFCSSSADVADPWYTGNFEVTYDDIVAGCKGFLKYIGL